MVKLRFFIKSKKQYLPSSQALRRFRHGYFKCISFLLTANQLMKKCLVQLVFRPICQILAPLNTCRRIFWSSDMALHLLLLHGNCLFVPWYWTGAPIHRIFDRKPFYRDVMRCQQGSYQLPHLWLPRCFHHSTSCNCYLSLLTCLYLLQLHDDQTRV